MKLPTERRRIRIGQRWMKRDIGLVVELTGRSGKGYYSYRKAKPGAKSKGHSVSEKDLYLFWQPL